MSVVYKQAKQFTSNRLILFILNPFYFYLLCQTGFKAYYQQHFSDTKIAWGRFNWLAGYYTGLPVNFQSSATGFLRQKNDVGNRLLKLH